MAKRCGFVLLLAGSELRFTPISGRFRGSVPRSLCYTSTTLESILDLNFVLRISDIGSPGNREY